MEELNAQRGPRPWTYLINESGVDEFDREWLTGQGQ
jgi:hypothetical protein